MNERPELVSGQGAGNDRYWVRPIPHWYKERLNVDLYQPDGWD
jgi:hypothetical protein